MRFHTKRKPREKVTHYIMIGASKWNFMSDKEAQKVKRSFAGQTDRASAMAAPEWSKFCGLNIRDTMEYSLYLARYKVKDEDK